MATRKVMTTTFLATMIACIIAVWKCRSGKANRNEGYRRERRGAKCFTVVPHRTR